MHPVRQKMAALSPRHRSGRVMLVAACLALAAQWSVIVFFLWPRIGVLEFLRLHYTADFGVDWVAEWWKIFVYPLLGLLALLFNVPLAASVQRTHGSIGHAVLFLTVVAEAALAAGGIMAVMLNIS